MWKDADGRPILYYHESTSNMIKAMIHVFKDVVITRYDKDGSEYAYRVPIRWAGKENYVQAKQMQQRRDRTLSEKLPAMSLHMPVPPQLEVDSGKQTNPDLEHCVELCPGEIASLRNGIPMKFGFELIIRSEQQHELFQIYEEIISRLSRPLAFIHILETDLKIKRDVPISITGADWNLYQVEFEKGSNSRPLELNMTFTTSGYYYPPIIKQGVIKDITIDYKNLCADDPENTSFVINRWYLDPVDAESNEIHNEILVQTLFGEDHIIKNIVVDPELEE